MTRPQHTGTRTVLVTGGGSGLGQAISTEFAASSYKVVRVDRSATALEATRAKIDPVADLGHHVCDVSNPEEVEGLFSALANAGHEIDVLVNCAGIGDERSILEIEPLHWRAMMDANLTSVFLMSRAAAAPMIARRWGRIINVSSQMGQRGCAWAAHYSAAKAGVLGLTKALARELVGHNVLVNAIAPGPLDTPMLRGLPPDAQAEKVARTPLRRVGKVEEVAPTAVLLAGDPSGNLYVGQTLGPNGGDVMA